ncbi:MAG: hypothetical protein ISS53_00625 [Dehalococcoidia bacterium]|nr:hypothetical protein [Dehalococcoidia bacterium]
MPGGFQSLILGWLADFMVICSAGCMPADLRGQIAGGSSAQLPARDAEHKETLHAKGRVNLGKAYSPVTRSP